MLCRFLGLQQMKRGDEGIVKTPWIVRKVNYWNCRFFFITSESFLSNTNNKTETLTPAVVLFFGIDILEKFAGKDALIIVNPVRGPNQFFPLSLSIFLRLTKVLLITIYPVYISLHQSFSSVLSILWPIIASPICNFTFLSYNLCVYPL